MSESITARARLDVMLLRPRIDEPHDRASRGPRLLDAIKLETRWRLLATAVRSFGVCTDHYVEDRAALVFAFPAIRQGRLIGDFYRHRDDYASALTHLIEQRRQIARDRKLQQ